MTSSLAVTAITLLFLVTVVIGVRGVRVATTTRDFYVASRAVSPRRNASAISGEYLSGAAFLGVAGLVLASGVDMLWYAVGATVGYLIVLALVAAPVRRSGAFTLPDFAEARLASPSARAVASVLVVAVGWLYLMAQLHAAGSILRGLTGAGFWIGPLLVAAVVLVTVLAGGMRSTTSVQSFHYWLKLVAIVVPALILVAVWQSQGRPHQPDRSAPVFRTNQSVTFHESRVLVAQEPLQVVAHGVVDDERVDGFITLSRTGTRIAAGSLLKFSEGSVVPTVRGTESLTNDAWKWPAPAGDWRGLYGVYSLIVALFLGTMGLPHVIVRFYTNADGRAARRSTVSAIVLVGTFYVFCIPYGALARTYAPDVLLTDPDSAVLALPVRMVAGLGGELLGALLAAGAFAAFLATSTGLAVAVGGVIAQELDRRRVRSGVRAFRVGASIAVLVPLALCEVASDLPIARIVGLVFTVAATCFCPLLLLGIWWRGLTAAGATAGLLVGGATSLLATIVTLARGSGTGWSYELAALPAAWSVPLAFLVTIVVSLLTAQRRPPGVARMMVRLHAPESLGLDRGDWSPEVRDGTGR